MINWQRVFITKAASEVICVPKESKTELLVTRKIQTAHGNDCEKGRKKKQKSRQPAAKSNQYEREMHDNTLRTLFVKKKFNILMVADQIKNDEYDRRFVDTCIVLCEQGHNVTILATYILTTQCFEIRHYCRKIFEIGNWIPRDICGAARTFCFFVRSVYLALWAYLCIQPTPDLIFCNCVDLSAMKYFRWIKNSKLLTFFQVFNLNQIPEPAPEYNISPRESYAHDLNYIDEVLCANMLTTYVFSYNYKSYNTPMTILYTTVRKPLVISIDFSPRLLIPADALTFLANYSLVPSAKFEIVIKAFGIMYTTLEEPTRDRCYLILMGLHKKNKINNKYMQHLKNQILCMNMQDRIFILTNVQHMYFRNLLNVCHAYIHIPHFVVCDDNIIEAMAAGKPIIATNSGFPCEVIKHKESGFLLPLDAENFADAMTDLVTNQDLYKNLCATVQHVYEENFSYPYFVKTINKIIHKYMESDKNSYKMTQDVIELNSALEEYHNMYTTLPRINVLASHQELITDKFYYVEKLYGDTRATNEDYH